MGKKILLVEDMLTNMLLAPILESAKYEVYQTSSFKDAKKEIESGANEFFAVIIDLNLDDTKDGMIIDYLEEKDLRTIIYSDPIEHSKVEDHINKSVVDYVVKQTSEDSNYILKLIVNLEQFENIGLLIVDDSQTTRAMLETFVKPLRFNKIHQAEDGIEALECVKKNENIQLVITDFNMPKMDGFELTQNLRKRYKDSQLSIISMSAEVSSEESAILLKYGVSSFLGKPYSKAHLNSIIHNEMDNLFAKQKNAKFQKDLSAFVRKLKSDNLVSGQEDKAKIIKLEKENHEYQNKLFWLKKDMETLTTAQELMKTKLKMQSERLGQKKGNYKANEIHNGV